MLKVLRGISLIVMLLTAASLPVGIWLMWHLDDWGLTPERAARRDGYCENAPVMRSHRQTPTTAIVVCQGMPTPLDAGYVYVSRMPWGTWWASPSGANFSYQSSEVTSTKWVDYIHTGPAHSVHTSLILLGRSRSPEVSAVEAVLSDGRTLRSDVTNGLFVFDAPVNAIGVKFDTLKVFRKDTVETYAVTF